jgi:fatty acid desaturase
MIIVPNHHGRDLYYFDENTKLKDFKIRQIISSCNYETCNNFVDYIYGGLNYQIEHHIYPDMSMTQYRYMQPKIKELCKKINIPYVQENALIRNYKTFRVFMNFDDMIYHP